MAQKKPFIHPAAIVDTKDIGNGTRIWAFVHVLNNVSIGENCNICDHCFLESGVTIGNNVTIKSGIYIWEGVEVQDDVFLGPNVTFTNDIWPRSKNYKPAEKIIIQKGASIGANFTILGGVTIGEYSMSGIGSVITKDIKPYSLVYGNPAKHAGWIDEKGNKLKQIKVKTWQSEDGALFKETKTGLTKISE